MGIERVIQQKITEKLEEFKRTIDDPQDWKKSDRESDCAFSVLIILAKAVNFGDIDSNTMIDVLSCSQVFQRKHLSQTQTQRVIERAFKATKGECRSLLYSDVYRDYIENYRHKHKSSFIRLSDNALNDKLKQRRIVQREKDVKNRNKNVKGLKTILGKGIDFELLKQHPYLLKKKLSLLAARFSLFFLSKDNHGEFLGYPLYIINSQKAFKLCGFNRIYYPHQPDKFERDRAVTQGSYIDDNKPLGRFYVHDNFRPLADNETCYLCEGAADAVSIMAATLKDCYSCESIANMPKAAVQLRVRYKNVICCVDNDEAGRDMKERLAPEFIVKMPRVEDDFSEVYIKFGYKAILLELETDRDKSVLHKLKVIQACRIHQENQLVEKSA